MYESLDRGHHTVRLISHTLLRMLLIPSTFLRALITLTSSTLIITSDVVTIIIPTRGRWGHMSKENRRFSCLLSHLGISESPYLNPSFMAERLLLATTLCCLSAWDSHKLLPEHNWYYSQPEKNCQEHSMERKMELNILTSFCTSPVKALSWGWGRGMERRPRPGNSLGNLKVLMQTDCRSLLSVLSWLILRWPFLIF